MLEHWAVSHTELELQTMGVGTFTGEEELQLLASLCPKPFATFFVA